MRQLVNNHTSRLDTTNAIYNQNLSGSIPYYDYERKYDQSQQKELSIKLLDVLGLPTNYTGWVDVDHISPDKLSMNMLSGEDFLNGGASPLGQFYGYDHTGKNLQPDLLLMIILIKKIYMDFVLMLKMLLLLFTWQLISKINLTLKTLNLT